METRVLVEDPACCCGGGGPGPGPSGCPCPDLSLDWTKQRITLAINSYSATIAPPGFDPVMFTSPIGGTCFPMVRNGCNLFVSIGIAPCAFTGSGLNDRANYGYFNPYAPSGFYIPDGSGLFWQSCIRHPFAAYDFVASASINTEPGNPYFSQFSMFTGAIACADFESQLLGTHNFSGPGINGTWNVNLTLDYQAGLDCGVAITGYPFKVSRLLSTMVAVPPGTPHIESFRYGVVLVHVGGNVWTAARSVPAIGGGTCVLNCTFTLTSRAVGRFEATLSTCAGAGTVIVDVLTEPVDAALIWVNNDFQLRHRSVSFSPNTPLGSVDMIFEI